MHPTKTLKLDHEASKQATNLKTTKA